MVIYKAKDYQDMSRKAANIISAQIIMKPNCVLGLATGSSPVGTYKQLIEWYKKGDLDFSQVTSVNLDEYKGLSPENDQSYKTVLNHRSRVVFCRRQVADLGINTRLCPEEILTYFRFQEIHIRLIICIHC